MRQFMLAVAVAAAFAGAAAAQPTTPYQSGFTNATTALGSLPPDGRQWLLEETARQASAPTSIDEIDEAIETAVGEDLPSAAKSLRASRADLKSALRYEIVREARRMLDREIRDRKKAADDSDEAMLGLQAVTAHRIRLGALESQANRRLTAKGRDMVAD
jgi:hypothetical protein